MTERAVRHPAIAAVLGVCGVAALVFGVALVQGRIALGPLPLDAVTVLVPLAILALVPLARRSGALGIERLGLLAPLLVFLLLELVSIAANGFGVDTYETFARYAGYGLLMVMIAAVARDGAVRRLLMWLVFGTALAVSAVGIASYVHQVAVFRSAASASVAIPAIRVVSTFENANFLGEYLVIVLGVALALGLAESGLRRLVAWTGLLPIGLTLVLTYTRGSWLAVAVAFSIALVALGVRYIWSLVAVAGVGAMIVPGAVGRFVSSFSTEGTAGFRLRLWRVAGEAIAERPLMGWGPGRFYDAFSATVREHPELGVGYSMYGAHNSYFTLTTETGVIGGLAFVWLVFSVIRMGLRAVSTAAKALRLEAAALSAGLGGFAVNALTSNSFQHPQAALFFWVVAGLLAGLALEVDAAARAGVVREEPAPGRWAASSMVVRALEPLKSFFRGTWDASATRRLLVGEPRGNASAIDGSIAVRLFFGRPREQEESAS